MTVVAATRSGNGAFGPYTTASDIGANVDDFACEGWADCIELFLSSTVAISITGFFAVPGRRGLVRIITNTGPQIITLKAQDVLSLEPNRIAGTDVVLNAAASVTLAYDYTAQRWRVLARTGATLSVPTIWAGNMSAVTPVPMGTGTAASTNFSGLILLGCGSTYDLRLGNRAGQLAISILANSTNVRLHGDLIFDQAGKGINLKTGTNCKFGTATLAGGTVAVANTAALATSHIFLSVRTPGGPRGHLSYTVNPGVSLTITSTSATESSVVSYLIVEAN